MTDSSRLNKFLGKNFSYQLLCLNVNMKTDFLLSKELRVVNTKTDQWLKKMKVVIMRTDSL